MKKLNFFGIGPKIAMVLFPWLTATIILSSMVDRLFNYSARAGTVLTIAGIILMIAGLIFYMATGKALLKGLKETRLMTKGPYRMCQNPLYAAIILFIIPALSLLLNSWLILTTSVVGYLLFKIFIKSEYSELEKFFGEEYRKYKRETPEFFPIPFRMG